MIAVFPQSILDSRQADEHFAPEAQAVRQLGGEVVLFDENALDSGQRVLPAGSLPTGPALLRGWMLTPARYEALHAACAQRDIELLTSPSQYQAAHQLPGWHPALGAWTAPAVWTVGLDVEALVAACRRLPSGGGRLKDYVKSSRDPLASVIADVHDGTLVRAVAERFVAERREGGYWESDADAGGLVVRAEMALRGPQWRSWWRRGECRLLSCHPDTPDDIPSEQPPLGDFAAVAQQVDSPFFVVDFAQIDDGSWRVVEIGDGQVSDRPRSVEPGRFCSLLLT